MLSAGAVGGHVINNNTDYSELQAVVHSTVEAVLEERDAENSRRYDETRTAFIHRVDTDHEECVLDHLDAGSTRVEAETVCGLDKLSEITIRLVQ